MTDNKTNRKWRFSAPEAAQQSVQWTRDMLALFGLWYKPRHCRHFQYFSRPLPLTQTVSLWELDLAKDLIRQRDHQHKLRPHSWLVHILEARELIEQRQTEQKLIRRKLQQLRERQPGRPRRDSTVQLLEVQQIAQAEQLMAEMQSKDADPRTRLLETLGEAL